jgi:hypothetical protein
MNKYLDGIGKQLHYGTTAGKRTNFAAALDTAVDADDPANVFFVSALGKDAVTASLSTATVAAFGCYSTSVDQPPIVRTTLAVATDGKTKGQRSYMAADEWCPISIQ